MLRGTTDHDEVMRVVSRAAALVLASDYEGLPHVVLEALACGTPVVSPPVGGVPEVVTDGGSGLLLPDASVRSLAAGIRRLVDDPELAAKLRTGARETGETWRIGATADGVEALLRRAAAGRPRAVFVGKVRVAPAPSDLDAKLRVMTRHADIRLVGVGRPGVRSVGVTRTYAFPTVRPKLLESVLFYALAPAVGVGLAAGRHRSAVVCQSPYEAVVATSLARALPRGARPRIVVEVHGDWRSASRLYGGGGRERLSSDRRPARRGRRCVVPIACGSSVRSRLSLPAKPAMPARWIGSPRSASTTSSWANRRPSRATAHPSCSSGRSNG